MFIRTARDAKALLSPMLAHRAEEMVVTAHLDIAQRLIAVTLEAPGKRGEVELPVGAILAVALRLGAISLVIAHITQAAIRPRARPIATPREPWQRRRASSE